MLSIFLKQNGKGLQWGISILGHQQEKCNVRGGSCCFLGVECAWFYFYMCFNTVCSHALSSLWFPVNQFSVTFTAGFTWLQNHKHAVTTNWLWFVVIEFCNCINCSLRFSGTLVLSCVSTLPFYSAIRKFSSHIK